MSYTTSNGRSLNGRSYNARTARTLNGRGTTLIARRGYSDLGARRGYGAMGAVECGAGQSFRSDVTFAGTKGQCMTDAQYSECKSTGKLYGQTCTVSSADGGVLSAIGSAVKGLLGLYGSAKAAEGQNAAYQQMLAQQQQQAAGPPSWLMPVAIAGVGVVALVLLTGKRRNPGRRRRNSALGGGGSQIGLSRRQIYREKVRKMQGRGKGYFTWRGKVRTHAQ